MIFSSNVLEHIEDDAAALRALRACLGREGTLLLYVPAFEMLWTGMDDKVGHFRRYTRAALARKLEEAGYRVRQARYCDSVGFGLALALRMLGGGRGEPSSAALRLYDRFLLPLSKAGDVALSPLLGKNLFAVARVREPA